MRNILIVGASKGLGLALSQGLGENGDRLYLVSRSRPQILDESLNIHLEWIEADLAKPESAQLIAKAIGNRSIDVFIYNAGIWEKSGFEEVPAEELLSIIQVNLGGLLLLSQRILPHIRAGFLKKIIFIGSTCGLENEGSDAVVYSATKFGVRGVAHALREFVRKDGIAVTCISPGSIASDVSFSEGEQAALNKHASARIPTSDLVRTVRLIMESSPAVCFKEIHLPALKDTDA